ncbi:MAG: hypothetical protein ABIT82_11660 [Ramlibacter sp.]
MANASTSLTGKAPTLWLGFKRAAVAVSLVVALVFLLGGSWLTVGEWFVFEEGDFENGLFWLVIAGAGLYLLGVWAANAVARLMAGCALSAGPDGLRLYTLRSAVAWRDIDALRYWYGHAKGVHFFSNLFTIGSSHPHLYLTVQVRPEAFHRATGSMNKLDLIVFMLSMRINRPQRKVFFACWPLEGATPELLYALERVASANGVVLEHDKKTTGFA